MTLPQPEVDRRLRARILERGLLSAPEVDRTQKTAEGRGLALPEALVAVGLLTEDQVTGLLAEELSLPFVFPYADAIDRELVARFPAQLLTQRKAIPFSNEGGTLVLATSELSTLSAAPEFEAEAGCSVAFALAPRRRVRRVLGILYGSANAEEGASAALDDLSAVSLFYGHLARAVLLRAVEVRFVPLDQQLRIVYRVGGQLQDRGREPLSALLGLVERARVLIAACRGARSFDTMGSLHPRLGGRDVTFDVAILPTRQGESVTVKLVSKESSPALPPTPAPAEVPRGPVEPSLDMPTLLLFTKEAGGSDLHLSAGAVPMIRVHGEMRKLTLESGREAPPLGADPLRILLFEILTDTQKSRLEAEKELDFSLTLGKDTRFRGNVFFQDRGLGAVFRVIPTKIKSCEELGLPPVIKGFAELEKGLVLCTGPTGSGKSTTLAALVDHINSTRRGHILTIEDPIEFVHAPKSCMVNQREVGKNTISFAHALRSALREDPDVILVGEMRDLETISLAITAAETGHLVFGTLHTSSAGKTVDRVINVFPSGEQAQIRAMLAESLQAVVAQLLLPKKGGKGRVAAHEILVASSGVRSMIREGKTFQVPSAIQTGAKYGMQSLEQSLTKLAMNGLIEQGEAEGQLAALGLGREDLGERKMAPEGPAATARPAASPGASPTVGRKTY